MRILLLMFLLLTILEAGTTTQNRLLSGFSPFSPSNNEVEVSKRSCRENQTTLLSRWQQHIHSWTNQMAKSLQKTPLGRTQVVTNNAALGIDM
jgi:hypothetical protein